MKLILFLMNQEAKGFFYELGVSQMTAPIELNAKELKQLDITDMDSI